MLLAAWHFTTCEASSHRAAGQDVRERERAELTIHFPQALVLYCVAQLAGGSQRPCCSVAARGADLLVQLLISVIPAIEGGRDDVQDEKCSSRASGVCVHTPVHDGTSAESSGKQAASARPVC